MLLLTACGGGSGGEPYGNNDENTGGTGTFANSEEFFDARIASRMDFCRTCHIPGGVADTDEGRRFLLSSNSGDDYANTFAAWQTLGEGVESNLLIVENADNSEPHSGGKSWPVGSDAYADMVTLLSCWDDPVNCVFDTVGEVVDQLPLLGSARGGHAWFDFCEGQPDTAQLPPDPRSLVQPGVNEGKAVMFNFYWKNCHVDPDLVGGRLHPETCGELRERRERGSILMTGNGVMGQASTFSGHEPDGALSVTASEFNNQWRVWGLTERPDNFEELFAQRTGLGPNPERNPYPLPGEDPNEDKDCDGDGVLDGKGGCGQLPYGYLQTRNHDGSWSGRINTNCNICHSADIGDAADGEGLGFVRGIGGPLFDAGLYMSDAFKSSLLSGEPSPVALIFDRSGISGSTRGTNGAQLANITALVGAVLGTTSPPALVDQLTTGLSGAMDTPAWWNVGHRPMKFIDAMTSGDAARVDMQLFTPVFTGPLVVNPDFDSVFGWVEDNADDGDAYILSLKSPPWPEDKLGAIDIPLAEQGAVLFHSKDLWADETENPVRRPEGGNGSCASCHGAYSPRYVNDPNYLDTPALEGIASYVTPLDLIGTDTVRSESFGDGTNEHGSGFHAFYPETIGSDNGNPDTNPVEDCSIQNQDHLRGDREIGYAAPPLYGIWASAPYLHNGSVPDLLGVLQPEARPSIWRRVSQAKRQDQEGIAAIHMGYDTDLGRAYDAEKVGWKYDELSCGGITIPYLDCSPAEPVVDLVSQQILELIFDNFLLGYGLFQLPILTDEDIEHRKIYNTEMWSQGNEGHEFTSVLTEQESLAIIEYLKTL